MITQSQIKRLFHYDPETGVFTRKVSTAKCVKIGDIAGCDNGRGYLRIKIDGKSYMSHRLAFIYMLGRLPHGETDHINHDKHDNRWGNLRECSRQENLRNSPIGNSNKTGYIGVHYHKKQKKYCAAIRTGSSRVNIGSFDSPSDASEAYRKEAVRLGYHENHGTTKTKFRAK